MSKSSAQRLASAFPYTTDLLHEPIASDGIRRSYCIVGWPPGDCEPAAERSTLDVLVEIAEAEKLIAEAERLGALHADEAVNCQLVTDDGGSSWCIVETLASRAVVIDLAAYADAMGCRRQPFPI